MDKRADNYRKQADYWREEANKRKDELKIANSTCSDLRDQNDRLYRERNEARSQRDVNEQSYNFEFKRAEGLRLELEKVSFWFVATSLALIVSVIVNVSQWMH